MAAFEITTAQTNVKNFTSGAILPPQKSKCSEEFQISNGGQEVSKHENFELLQSSRF